jgi:predicted CXXCH cytochrome family protein
MRFNKIKMHFILLTIFIVTIALKIDGSNLPQVQDFSEENQCITCHRELEILPEDYEIYDVHLRNGLSCVGCHGGDPGSDDEDISMSPENGFIGVPSREDIPKFCGKCHSNPEFIRDFHPGLATDQVSQYYTSVHGQKFLSGDKKVAVCINCHTTHGILSSKDPRSSVYPLNVPMTCRKCHSNSVYMKPYKIPSNQYELYSESVHGVALLDHKDIGAPACNDCHGNHGATPPGLSSVTFICGNCHVNNMEFFRQSRMAQAFEDMQFHGCEQCHGYHAIKKTSDKLVGVNKEAFCVNCHEDGDTGYEAAKNIKFHILELVSLYDSASTKATDVQIKGMNDIDIGFLLQEGRQNLIESRTLIHTFDLEKVKAKTEKGKKVVNEAIDLAEKEFDKYYTRRRGFAIATVVLVIFAVALFLKIRDIEKTQKSKNESV